MKKVLRYLMTGLWLVFATASLALWWLKNPDMYPTFPDFFWAKASQFYGASCCEEQADLELLIRLGVSFLVVSLSTIIIVFLWNRMKLTLLNNKK